MNGTDGPSSDTTPDSRPLIAYELAPNPGYVLEPASPRRDWMDTAPGKTPYRCLPMVMANQAGWVVRCPCNLSAVWNGKTDTSGLSIEVGDKELEAVGFIGSQFGMGIITFRLPWLFRTVPGIGMWVHGPANEPKDNLTPLEGLVETDWLESPFTMNWKIQRRRSPVYFRKGDVICTLTPAPLDLLEGLAPEFRALSSEPALMNAVAQAKKRRLELVEKQYEFEDPNTPWERTYMKGERMDGRPEQGHRTRFNLRPFESL